MGSTMTPVLCTNIKTFAKTGKILNEHFENICDWFVDNKLNIDFGDDKLNQFFPIQRNKYKTTCINNVSWMCIRRVNVW